MGNLNDMLLTYRHGKAVKVRKMNINILVYP